MGAWHEQELWRRRVDRKAYEARSMSWNPARFDPNQWLDLAQEAGMRYLCLTTKHHDGFCLWDSAFTQYKITRTPYGKDIVGLLAEACRKRGLPLVLYYSVADWHHPAYPNQGRHHELPPQPDHRPDWAAYMDYLKSQVRELCTNYGTIGGIWWDMNVPGHVDPSVSEMIRQLQPAAVINNRGFDAGDFGTPERDYDESPDAASLAFERRTEACQSVGIESWGFRVGEDYYTPRHLIRSVDKYLARGANYLLNVGPDEQGLIPPEAAARVKAVGRWYRAVAESFDASPASALTTNRNVLLTRRGDVLYVHLWREPLTTGVKLAPLSAEPREAVLLNDGSAVRCVVDMPPSEHLEQRRVLRLVDLPVDKLAHETLVIRLSFAPGVLTSGESGRGLGEDDLRVR